MRRLILSVVVFSCLALAVPIVCSAQGADPTRVFLDTDIGSDVDDVLAVLTVLGAGDFKLLGISTVYGETERRARIARRLLELAGHGDVPVGAGVSSTLLRRKQPRDWSVQLSQHLDQEPREAPGPEHGVDLMIRSIHENPGLTLLALGPLTNVAVAIVKDPTILENIGMLMVVGGATHFPSYRERGTIFVDYKSEYNLNCDPDAAMLVFESGVPILMSGLAPALQVTVSRSQAEAWQKQPSEVARWTGDRILERLDRHGSNATHLGDVLGCLLAVRPGLASIQTLPVSVEMWGKTLRTVIDPTGSGRSVEVVMTVEVEQFGATFQAAMDRSLSGHGGR